MGIRNLTQRLARIDHRWWFLAGFVLMCSAYEYGRVLHLRPQPHHIMRQCDCLGPTYNYFYGDPNILHPWMCNLHADHDTSGESAGEFPGIYWIMGMLWRVIGQSEFAYRLFGLLLHALGSWALYRTSTRILGSGFWGAWLSLLFFTSPVVAYFAVSFLPDVPAFDLAILGWWCFVTYHDRKRKRWLLGMFLLMALGTLLKVTAGMSVLALLGVLVVESVVPDRLLPKWRAFPQRGWAWLGFLLLFAMVFSWYMYAAWYNGLHGAGYTPNSFWPLWETTPEVYAFAVWFGLNILVYELFAAPMWILLFAGMAVFFVAIRRFPLQVVLVNIALLCGVILFTIGWFKALENHDYYFINPQIMAVVMILTALWYVGRRHPQVLRSPWAKGVAMALLTYSTVYTMFDMRLRTRGGTPLSDEQRPPLLNEAQIDHWRETQFWSFRGLMTITPYARSLGITPDDRVITVRDRSWQNALYVIGQRGWNDGNLGLEDTASFEHCLRNGARYLFVNESDWLQRPYMQRYLQHPIGEYEGVHIFDLRPLSPLPTP